MTREDRDVAIADNLSYVAAALEQVPHDDSTRIVYAGFSQGVAMAFRAAAASRLPVAGVMSVGGDVPPELDRAALARIGRVLLCRGARDQWYTPETFANDRARLEAAGVALTVTQFEGEHEWSNALLPSASGFLSGIVG